MPTAPTQHQPGNRPDPDRSAETADLAAALAAVSPCDLGTRISAARRSRSQTQAQVAEGLISAAYMSRIESGDRRPELKVLESIADRLGTSAHEILLGITPAKWSSRQVEIDWAHLAVRTGDPAEALARTASLLEDLSPRTRLARRAQFVRALAFEAVGQYGDALDVLEPIIEPLDETEHPTETDRDEPPLEALMVATRCYRFSGELGKAIEVGTRARHLIRDLGLNATPEAVRLVLTVAAAHAENGDLGYAARLCARALESAEQAGSAQARASCYWNASVVESRRGHHAQAVDMAHRALAVLDREDDARSTSRLRTQLGIMLLRLDSPTPTEALDYLRAAERDLRTTEGALSDLASNRIAQARAHLLLGEPDVAERVIRDCLGADVVGAPAVEAEALCVLGRIAFSHGRRDDAVSHFESASSLLTSHDDLRGAAQLWFDLGTLWSSAADPGRAAECFRRAGSGAGLRSTLDDLDAPAVTHGAKEDRAAMSGTVLP